MPPRKTKRPSKADIKAKADRAEGKKTKGEYDPLNPSASEDEEEELFPGGVRMAIRRRPGAGRPSKYRPEYARIAKAMVNRGSTIGEIAELFGVANSTIYLWQQTHAAFSEIFSDIGEPYDVRVERTLAERALGYTYDAVKIFNNKGKPVIVPYREHVPPDISAIKLWLSARKPERWRVKDELELSTNTDTFLEIWRTLGDKKNEKTEPSK
jgi:Helix-turn-helix domain of resolvase